MARKGIKAMSVNYLRVVEEIQNSSTINEDVKKRAVNEIDLMAKGKLKETVKFNHNASRLSEMFNFGSTEQGWGFWAGIQQHLRGDIR